MIELYCPEDGRTYYVAPSIISWVSTTSDAEIYHGKRSKVMLRDGMVMYCSKAPADIAALVEASQSRSE